LETAAADTVYIPVVSVLCVSNVIVDAISVAFVAPKKTNVDPDLFAIDVVTPVIDGLPTKLLNDGVTFADGFVRVTVVLDKPTVNVYAFVLSPPENAHWIARVP
jgi:hypothetical protein